MRTRFEWHTEEPGANDNPRARQAGGQKPKKRTPWLLLLFICLLALSGGYLLYLQLAARAADATVAAETAVLTTHALVQQAVADGDQELFTSLVAQSDAGWAHGQRSLFENKLLLDRQPLGLKAADAPQVLRVETAASLAEADIITEYSYLADDSADPLRFRLRYRYREGRSGWRLVAPIVQQGVEWRRASGTYLTVDYPSGEAALVLRLHRDLEQATAHMCTTLPNIGCRADLHFTVYFDPDPNSLAEIADPKATLRQPSQAGLRLPSPAVVGTPADDAAYAALLHGYARHVVAAAITESVGYRCCAKGRFYQALLDRQLATLGLKTWPLNEAAYVRLYRSPVPDEDALEQLWQAPPLNENEDVVTLRIYTLVSMLQRYRPELTIADAQRLLVGSATYAEWRSAIRAAGEPSGALSNSNH